MRDYSTCIHEAAHIVAAKHLIGPVILDVRWQDDAAAVQLLTKGADPFGLAATAFAGGIAQALLAPDSDARYSEGDLDMVDTAYTHYSGGTYLASKVRVFGAATRRLAHQTVMANWHEIESVAEHLQQQGTVPSEYLDPTVKSMQETLESAERIRSAFETAEAQSERSKREYESEQLREALQASSREKREQRQARIDEIERHSAHYRNPLGMEVKTGRQSGRSTPFTRIEALTSAIQAGVNASETKHHWLELEAEVETLAALYRDDGDETSAALLSNALREIMPPELQRGHTSGYATKLGGPPRPLGSEGRGS